MGYSAVEMKQIDELAARLAEIGKGVKPVERNAHGFPAYKLRSVPVVYRCVVEYARSNHYWKDKVIRPYIEQDTVPASWADECYESSRRYGKSGPTWTGD